MILLSFQRAKQYLFFSNLEVTPLFGALPILRRSYDTTGPIRSPGLLLVATPDPKAFKRSVMGLGQFTVTIDSLGLRPFQIVDTALGIKERSTGMALRIPEIIFLTQRH